MDTRTPTADPVHAPGLQRLHGATVLVKSTRDLRHPPTAMRGTIEVRQHAPDAAPEVSLAIEFPQMFRSPAHHRTIVLDHADLTRLLASEYNGTFEFTIDDELE